MNVLSQWPIILSFIVYQKYKNIELRFVKDNFLPSQLKYGTYLKCDCLDPHI